MEEIHDDPIEIPDDIKLYRIVKIWSCDSGNINDLNSKVFSARREKALSLYLSTEDTPQQALDNYLETTDTDKSQIQGVVAVTARVFRQFGVNPICDGDPVPSHVTAAWKTNEDYKKMKIALTEQAISFGWQLGPYKPTGSR